MGGEKLHKLECELRQNGYTRSIVNNSETTKESNSYFWLKVFVKRDFNTNKDCVTYTIKYNIKHNPYVGNGVSVPDPEVSVIICNNFGTEGKTETEIFKPYLSPEHAEIIAEEMWKCGNKHIITKKFIKYYWNMFKNWVILHFDTILAVITVGLFCGLAILHK